ncbi:four helix bundle protein [bacterium (Candidatus Torokbacteria) CG_4_10_14_0_2_um_filter_35_8]|nr:MAG: four helix bundle protein [bacterium (Candidatus Torokbacteria) CG_4_10_14_0_2_um_filter_35_8]
MTNDQKYDLEERTAEFGGNIVKFSKEIPQNPVTKPLISQLVRSGTSIGANYCEADDAESRKDFKHKIGICKKESRETKHWLRMIAGAVPNLKEKARKLWNEAKELNLIFNAIIHSTKKKD